MDALVKTAFPGRPDHEVMTRTIAAGETITGDLAQVAVREGWAEFNDPGHGEPDVQSDGLEEKTVKELVAYANEKSIGLGLARSKAQIVAAIRAANVTA